MSRLFLKAAVAVVPVGAALRDWDSVSKCLAGSDARKTEAGNAVHIGGRSDSMPMNRGRHLQSIGDRYCHRVAFTPFEQRTGNRTVDCGRDAAPAGEIDRRLVNSKIEMAARQHRRFDEAARCEHRPSPQIKTRNHTASHQSLNEPPPANRFSLST